MFPETYIPHFDSIQLSLKVWKIETTCYYHQKVPIKNYTFEIGIAWRMCLYFCSFILVK